MDDSTAPYIRRAREVLGENGFLARSVPYDEVAVHYRAADIFALASLAEGFGRVFLEALMHGLPVIAHNHPVLRYVIGPHGRFIDMSRPGTLTDAIAEELRVLQSDFLQRARWARVNQEFDWKTLAVQYVEMFRQVAAGPMRPCTRRRR